MEETIELRELIEIVWKGKWIIAGLTALFMFAAAIFSWFVIPEKFESKATVQVNSGVQDTGILTSFVAVEFTPEIFSQRIKNSNLLNEALSASGVESEMFIEDLTVIVQENTNLIDLTYKSNSAETAHDHLELFINKTKDRMNTSVKKTLTELEKTYTTEAKHLSTEIEVLIEQYNQLIVSNNLPEILTMQTLVNSQIIMSITDEQTQALSNIDGAIHNELMQMQARIESKSTEYGNVLNKYQSVKTGLDSFRPDPFIRLIVEPTLSEKPAAPNKLLNVVIAMIIGLLLGVGIVFFRNYWIESSSKAS
ncbi:Wzz/FepE/Etk N-terminal domain-containing protein [Paenisporosarcina quisquiliarum]|uniref:Wzz/FepE/Etk N-terminal domain-containing protein n=1 Tax=Paenisporosarcina quisquiliarum TaxID=365346 RepID=UPI0037361060